MAGILDQEVDPEQGVQVWEDETDKAIYLWYVHPMHALTQEVLAFSEELKYYDRFGGAPAFDKASSRWADAVQTYDKWLKWWQAPKANKAGYS